MFHSFFSSLAKSKYLLIFSLSFIFTQWSVGTVKSTKRQVLLYFFKSICSFIFLSINFRPVLLTGIGRSICISKSQRILYISFSRADSSFYIHHLVIWYNFNLLHNSKWITFPTQSYLILYIFCVSLLHLLMINHFISFSTKPTLLLLLLLLYGCRVLDILRIKKKKCHAFYIHGTKRSFLLLSEFFTKTLGDDFSPEFE